MRYYELMMVVVPQIDDDALSATLERVNHYVSERGGTVVRQELGGKGARDIVGQVQDLDAFQGHISHRYSSQIRLGEYSWYRRRRQFIVAGAACDKMRLPVLAPRDTMALSATLKKFGMTTSL